MEPLKLSKSTCYLIFVQCKQCRHLTVLSKGCGGNFTGKACSVFKLFNVCFLKCVHCTFPTLPLLSTSLSPWLKSASIFGDHHRFYVPVLLAQLSNATLHSTNGVPIARASARPVTLKVWVARYSLPQCERFIRTKQTLVRGTSFLEREDYEGQFISSPQAICACQSESYTAK